MDTADGESFRGIVEIEPPATGPGALNDDDYVRCLAENHPNIPIIIEYLDESDVPRAKRFLGGKLRALDV